MTLLCWGSLQDEVGMSRYQQSYAFARMTRSVWTVFAALLSELVQCGQVIDTRPVEDYFDLPGKA